MIVDNPQMQIEDENILTVLPVASKETSILKKLYQHEQKSSLIAPLSIDQFVGIIYPLFRPEEQEIILQEVFGTKNKESVTRYLLSMFENHPQLKLGNCCASTIDLSLLNEHLELLHCLGLNLDENL
jgi:hypothetical protein